MSFRSSALMALFLFGPALSACGPSYYERSEMLQKEARIQQSKDLALYRKDCSARFPNPIQIMKNDEAWKIASLATSGPEIEPTVDKNARNSQNYILITEALRKKIGSPNYIFADRYYFNASRYNADLQSLYISKDFTMQRVQANNGFYPVVIINSKKFGSKTTGGYTEEGGVPDYDIKTYYTDFREYGFLTIDEAGEQSNQDYVPMETAATFHVPLDVMNASKDHIAIVYMGQPSPPFKISGTDTRVSGYYYDDTVDHHNFRHVTMNIVCKGLLDTKTNNVIQYFK